MAARVLGKGRTAEEMLFSRITSSSARVPPTEPLPTTQAGEKRSRRTVHRPGHAARVLAFECGGVLEAVGCAASGSPIRHRSASAQSLCAERLVDNNIVDALERRRREDLRARERAARLSARVRSRGCVKRGRRRFGSHTSEAWHFARSRLRTGAIETREARA